MTLSPAGGAGYSIRRLNKGECLMTDFEMWTAALRWLDTVPGWRDVDPAAMADAVLRAGAVDYETGVHDRLVRLITENNNKKGVSVRRDEYLTIRADVIEFHPDGVPHWMLRLPVEECLGLMRLREAGYVDGLAPIDDAEDAA